MSGRSAVAVPVALRFADARGGGDSWGRLLSLSSTSAEVSTQSVLRRDEAVLLSFELGGEDFKDLAARVVHAESDADGFCRAEVRFLGELDRRRLAKVLLDVLSRR